MACDPVYAATVTFAATTVTILTLKKPEFGNSYDKDLRLIPHRTRGGDLFLYKRGDAINGMEMGFNGLNYETKNLFETFVDASRGKLITFTDHFADVYIGFFDSWSYVESAKGNGFDISVSFQVA